MRTGGQFILNEQQLHINVLELLAAFFGLKAFVKNSDTHVKILSDNTTTVHGINKMGSNIPTHAIDLFVTYGTGQNKIIFGLLQPISQVNIMRKLTKNLGK